MAEPREAPSASAFVEAFGGVRGLLDSALPATVFVLVRLVTDSLSTAIWAAVASGGAVLVLRVLRGQPLQQAVSGFFGLAVAVLVARATGSGEGFFLPGIVTTALTGVGFVVSLLLGRPAVGLVLAAFDPAYAGWREHPPLGLRRREEAFHAFVAEGGDPAVEGALGGPGPLRPVRDRLAEEDERPDPLVLLLLGPRAQELDLLPLVGGVYALPLPPSHASPSRERCVGAEGCHESRFAAIFRYFKIQRRRPADASRHTWLRACVAVLLARSLVWVFVAHNTQCRSICSLYCGSPRKGNPVARRVRKATGLLG